MIEARDPLDWMFIIMFSGLAAGGIAIIKLILKDFIKERNPADLIFIILASTVTFASIFSPIYIYLHP